MLRIVVFCVSVAGTCGSLNATMMIAVVLAAVGILQDFFRNEVESKNMEKDNLSIFQVPAIDERFTIFFSQIYYFGFSISLKYPMEQSKNKTKRETGRWKQARKDT